MRPTLLTDTLIDDTDARAEDLAGARVPGWTTERPWHVLGIEDVGSRIGDVLATALHYKGAGKNGALPAVLAGRSIALLFEKPSTRTRVSFEIGVARLGGTVTILDAQTSQMSRGESLEDTASVLSRYVDAIVYRARSHADAEEAARHASVPVVNALTEREHPCQTLADLMTLAEEFPAPPGTNVLSGLAGRTLAWVGDGNNVAQSLIIGAMHAGMNVHIATPPGHEPAEWVVARAQVLAAVHGTRFLLTNDPASAVEGADAVSTDTWTSMGQDAERDARLAAFAGYTVDDDLMALALPHAVFLHCLPGHWGEEATHAVAHGPRSRILVQAENRMWSQMALLAHLLGHGTN